MNNTVTRQVLGKIMITSKGEYNSLKSYEILDAVTYQGSSYLSKKYNNNSLPTNADDWQLLAQKGDTYELSEEDLQRIAEQITSNANSAFNQNVKEKTDGFNSNANSKTEAYNTNATEKLGTYNSNHTAKLKEYNDNANSKLSAYNANTVTKTTEYNSNHTDKLSAYDTNASSKIDEYNTNADARLEEYNTNADNKIAEYDEHSKELNNKIVSIGNDYRMVKDQLLYTGEDTGTFIHVEDSAMAEMKEIKVDGVCEQVTTSGKNLLRIDNQEPISVTKSGITVSIDKNGIITINGTATGDDFFGILTDNGIIGGVATSNKVRIPLDTTKTYSFSTKSISGIYARGWHISSKVFINGISTWKEPAVNGSIVLNNSNGLDTIYLGFSKGLVFNNFKFTIQLEEGTEATSYEPYTGGQPSPSPDYPQPIEIIDEGFEVVSCGKNLLDKTLIERGKASDYGVVGIIPNKTNNSQRLTLGIENAIKVKPNTTYTLTIPNGFGSAIAQLESDLKVLGDTGWVLSNTYTMTTKSNAKYVSFNFKKADNSDFTDDDWNNFIDGTLQFELGEPTEIEPYQETRVHIDLKGEFIGKISDIYKDTLRTEYFPEEGQYHLMLDKMIGKKIFSSDDNWNRTANENDTVRFSLNNNQYNLYGDYDNSAPNFKSNYFMPIPFAQLFRGKLGISWWFSENKSRSSWILGFGDSRTLLEFKDWLSNNQVEVYYPLAKPYTIDLGVIDMPMSYKDITNIFTDSNLLPTINAKYYRTFEKTVQNLQINEKSLKQEITDLNATVSTLDTRLKALENKTVEEPTESEGTV